MNYVSLKNGQMLKIIRQTKDSTKEDCLLVSTQDEKNPEVLDVFDVKLQISKKYYFYLVTEQEFIDHVKTHGSSVPFELDINADSGVIHYTIEIIG